jgi:hypothetical protein
VTLGHLWTLLVRMCGTIDPGSYIRWLLGFGLKTRYDRSADRQWGDEVIEDGLRNKVVSSLVWLWWVIDLVRFEFEFGTILFCFSFIFVSFGESRLLVSWCAGGRCGMACSIEDHSRSKRPGVEVRGWSHRSGTRWLGDREVRWCHVRFAPCTWRWGARVS